jgi:hypothetical protein
MYDWDARRVVNRLRKSSDADSYYAPRKNRHLITSYTGLDRGYYIGDNAEIILVDLGIPSLGSLYRIAKNRSTKRLGFLSMVDKGLILESVYGAVSEAVRFDKKAADGLASCYARKRKDIPLSMIVAEGFGDSHHQALVSGAILETFKKERIISETPHVERSFEYLGGHGWCTCDYHGDAYVLAPSQGVFDRLDRLPYRTRVVYENPHDLDFSADAGKS